MEVLNSISSNLLQSLQFHKPWKQSPYRYLFLVVADTAGIVGIDLDFDLDQTVDIGTVDIATVDIATVDSMAVRITVVDTMAVRSVVVDTMVVRYAVVPVQIVDIGTAPRLDY
jgi:hypothetical protein